jgi:hypothetical protein
VRTGEIVEAFIADVMAQDHVGAIERWYDGDTIVIRWRFTFPLSDGRQVRRRKRPTAMRVSRRPREGAMPVAMRMLGLIAVLLAGPAAAQPATAPQPPSSPPKVSEVVVPGGPQPRIVATFPAEGSSVSAGELAMKLVFDAPMTAARWSFGPAQGAAFPACLSQPRLLADKHTFVILCQVKASTAYAVELGGPPGFASDGGRDMAPTALKFRTGEEIVDDLHGALDEAGLTDADEPIMTWNDDGRTPPKSVAPGG